MFNVPNFKQNSLFYGLLRRVVWWHMNS